MDPRLQTRIEALLGKAIVQHEPVAGGYTPAERVRVRLDDGTRAFAKIGTTPQTAHELRREHAWYTRLRGDFMPQLLAFGDDALQPILLLEDLGAAHWPPPWSPGQLTRLCEALERMASTRPLPPDLPALASQRAELAGWTRLASDPSAFLSLGFCTQAWLERALPSLLAAEAEARLDGGDLIHGDLRSDNLCFHGERVVFVDWNGAARGHRAADRAFLAPSLRLEAGPLPDEFVPGAPELAALVAGFFAVRAGLPTLAHAPRVRAIQLRQLRVALPWAVRALDLPPLDGNWAQAALREVDAAFDAGAIDEAQWHGDSEEIIGDAYLASADPRAQSGKSGDETDWRWSRELVLDALPRGGSVLDVGCANGYLCESLERWAAERGLHVTAYGLEISARLSALARMRLNDEARIWTGNVLEWTPPRRFDLVHTGIEYAPPPRRRELVLRILREFLVPGGRLVLRAERVHAGEGELARQLERLGFTPDGVLERRHPETGVLRRTVWLSAPGG